MLEMMNGDLRKHDISEQTSTVFNQAKEELRNVRVWDSDAEMEKVR